MRFSIANLLLASGALAAPAQEIGRAPGDTRHDSLVARGLVPILPRVMAPIRPVRPVEPVHAPVGADPVVNPNGPDAPVPLRPNEPGAPSSNEGDGLIGLRPNEPVTPNVNEPETPGALRPDDPANPPKPTEPDTPASSKPDDAADPAKNPDEPETVGGAKPDDDAPTTDRSGEAEACLLKRCTAPEPLPVGPKSRWKTNKVEEKRVKGSLAHQKLDEVIKDNKPEKGLKHLETDPKKQQPQMLNEKNAYNAKSELNPKTMPDLAYLQDPMFKGQFKAGEQWPESTVRNSDAQVKKFDEWRSQYADQLRKSTNNDKEKMKKVDHYLENDLVPGKDMVMLRTFENPSQGTMVIKDSFNEKNDLYRSYEYKFKFDDVDGPPVATPRPAMGTSPSGKPIPWTDQTMANWRAACLRDGVDVKSLKFMTRDNIVTTDTQKVFLGVQEQMGWKQGVLTVRRNAADPKEAASFDAVAGTVHGNRPILMAADHFAELGGLKVVAFHIFTKPGPLPQYNMVIEFGH